MEVKIGFVLLTHNKPEQTVRLISTLNLMFNFPKIVCHHDFSKTNLPENNLTSNVTLVKPHIKTSWSKFSVVEATMRALQLMYRSSDSPDWFILLSGADYPIKPANRIIKDLKFSPYDVHIHHEKIKYNSYDREWQKLCYDRYHSLKILIPSVNKKFHYSPKSLVLLRQPSIVKNYHPFSESFCCFAGEHWFCANRKAAKYLIEFHNTKPAFASYYRKLDRYTIVPEESYYHTIFCNSPDLKVSENHWRYIDWSLGGCHPKTLGVEDLEKMKSSTAHFARKFDASRDRQILLRLNNFIYPDS